MPGLALAGLLGCGIAGLPASAVAQTGQGIERPGQMRPSPQARGDDLDKLFAALKAAPDEASAKAIEDRIWSRFLVSRSDTANLLMGRVDIAIEAHDIDLAFKLLDAIIEIRSDYAEAWNRRATLHYVRKDYERALADIRQVLAHEPRHFGALSGLATIMQELGDDRRALDIYRRLLDLHPHMSGVADQIKALTETVEGRDI